MMTSEYRAHINPAKKKNFLNTASTTDSILNQQIQIVDASTWIFTQTFCARDHVIITNIQIVLFIILVDLAEIFQVDLSLLCVSWKCIQGTKTISNFFC